MPKERAQLSSFRTIGATLAGTVIGVVLPLIVYYKDGGGNQVMDGTKATVAAAICSIGAIACYLLCYHMTTERVKVEQKTEKFNLRELLKGLAAFNLICWAIITDVIDDTEVQTGERSDGTIYAVYSFARKMGQAASAAAPLF